MFGRNTTVAAGDRVAIVKVDGPTGFAVLAGRCDDERVDAVEVRVPDGETLWRIESAKGVIERSFVVGADAPFGADTVVELRPVPAGVLEAVITVDGSDDRERFDPSQLDRADAPEAPCSDADLGLVSLAFIVGAMGVVVAYGSLVRRYAQHR